MKESKILKIISYILFPILVGIIILSVIYAIDKEDIKNLRDKKYFFTDSFVEEYMCNLSVNAYELIHRNMYYSQIEDDDMKICYNNNYDEFSLPEHYYLIIYENLAFTNVELTSTTNTIESIKNYIAKMENVKHVNIISGNVESDNELFNSKAIKYLENFKMRYYTDETYVDENNYRYIYCDINNLEIYSIYKEEINLMPIQQFAINSFDRIEDIEGCLYGIIPICFTLVLLIAMYLLNSIGHEKGKEGIVLNDIDNIDFEILLFFDIILFIIISILAKISVEFIYNNNYIYGIVMIFSLYFICYIICAIMATTFIKRIKAKVFIKNTILYKFLKFISKKLTKITNVMGLMTRLILVFAIYVLISIFLIFCFNICGVLLSISLGILILYEIAKRINSIKKIELHLKKMCEGNVNDKLNMLNITKEFENMVNYINDISNGFEVLVQERMKSERLKTELITNVSHDIKTPLTSIINYIDLLKNEQIENPNVKEYIEVLENKSQRLKKLTEDLIEASKASSGNVKLNIEKINVNELINQSVGELEDKFKDKNLEIILSSNKDIYVNADSRYMFRIIENLFSNITKYALEGSRVYIDVIKDEKVRISIKNISRDKLNISEDELMQRFIRGDKSRSTDGSGLGLSISKSLTELQNGEFNLKIDGDLFKVELIFEILN